MKLNKKQKEYLRYVLNTHEVNPDQDEEEYQAEIEMKISLLNALNNN